MITMILDITLNARPYEEYMARFLSSMNTSTRVHVFEDGLARHFCQTCGNKVMQTSICASFALAPARQGAWQRSKILLGRCASRLLTGKCAVPDFRAFHLQRPTRRWHIASCQMNGASGAKSYLSRPYGSLWDQASVAPNEPGVYLFMDIDRRVLYVGKAISLQNRVRSYLVRAPDRPSGAAPASGLVPRIAAMINAARSVELVATGSEAAALALEATLVRERRPPYNVLLKDDRRHPYAVITFSEEYPRVLIVRNPPRYRRRNNPDRYFGPFVDEGRLRRILRVIQSAFPIRQRAKPLHPSRTCMNFDIGKCPGVCQRLISPEDYGRTMTQISAILSGRVKQAVAEIESDLKAAIVHLEFEKAATLRDRRDSITAGLIDRDSTWLDEDVSAAASVSDPANSVSRDIVASIAGRTNGSTHGIAKVALFQVRDGSVLGRLVFSVQGPARSTATEFTDEASIAGSAMNAALTEHYSNISLPEDVPDEIVLATPVLDDNALLLLAVGLSEKRGKAVRVKRGTGRTSSICKLVKRNAELELELEQKQRCRLDEGLASLAVLLAPYFDKITPHCRLRRIECYDISHTSGSHAVGAMAVLHDGSPVTSENRRYILGDESSALGHPDDYESLKATLRRRFDLSSPARSGTSSLDRNDRVPDLIVIDGGKGQLMAAVEVLRSSDLTRGIPVVSLAKRVEEVFVPGETHAINSAIGVNSAVTVLCRARDEAHRAAVRDHRRVRGRAALQSGLDNVPGLGRARRMALLAHFPGGAPAIAASNVAELEQVPGIGKALAQRIHMHLSGGFT
jgi:excinuclease ABC subunit C